MRLIERRRCVLTGADDLRTVRTLPRFPVHMGCVSDPPETDRFAPMTWTQSVSSGSLQLNPLVPLEWVYLGAHNAAIGETWRTHHRQFGAFLGAESPRRVLEFGGADGFLASVVREQAPDVEWTIVDPNPTVDDDSISVVRGMVEPGMSIPDDVDVIVHSHFLEHVYDPRSLLEWVAEASRPGTRMIFSLPSMLEQLRSGYANALNFEHTVFLRHEYMRWLLEITGFEVLRSQPYRDHSIFFDCRVAEPHERVPLALPDLGGENRALLEAFLDGMAADARDLVSRIERWPGDVYLFGAHVFAQFLLGSGLPEEHIVGILDNNPAKAGRRLYGSQLLVSPPSVLAGKAGVAVILRAAHYNDEIRRQIREEINGGIEFW
jgi:SAM-dependent methyltransferase